MGIFKKTEKETIYDDYDDESYRDEELLEEAEKEKTANKMFNILKRLIRRIRKNMKTARAENLMRKQRKNSSRPR